MITDQNVHVLEKDERIQEELTLWLYYNGGPATLNEFTGLEPEEMKHIMEYIEDFSLYEEVTVEDRRKEKHADDAKVLNVSKGITTVKAPNSSSRQIRYLLVHAGLGNFSPERELEDYSIDELVWAEMDFERQYFDDRYLVVGHVPTQMIKNNPRPGYIYRSHNNIAIDCGACFDGRLAAICLETGEEFYSDQK